MININGKILPAVDASLSAGNRGFAYGDMLFETLRVVNEKIVFWEDHYFRLMASMRIMRMEIPQFFSPEFLEKEILDLVKQNQVPTARVKFSVFRKEGGKYTPLTHDVDYIIQAEVLDSPFYLWNDQPYEVEIYKDYYLSSGLLSTIKTNNKALQILAGIFAEENGYSNCLLLNEQKTVVETTNANIFLLKGKHLKTPPLEDGCLNGVARKNILKIIKNLSGFTSAEESISAFELQQADEIFISNTILGIQPVTKFRKKTFNTEIAKELLGKLNAHARLS